MMLSDELVAEDSLQLIQVLVREAHGDHLLNLEWIISKNDRLLKHTMRRPHGVVNSASNVKNMVSVNV
jgi:hypothetical protein